VPSKKTLERLDLTVANERKKQSRRSNSAGLVAAPAPSRIEPFAPRDTLGERT